MLLRLRGDIVQAILSANLFENFFVNRTWAIKNLWRVAKPVDGRFCIDEGGDIWYETSLIVRIHTIKLCGHNWVALARNIDWFGVHRRVIGGAL